MRRRFLTTCAWLAIGALSAAACANEAHESPLGAGDRRGTDLGTADPDLDAPIGPDTGLTGGDAPTSEEVVEAALVDVEDFWERTFPEVYGAEFEPIAGGFWPYGPDTEQPPCGTPAPEYDQIAANAFYCPVDDLIAWDAVNLIPGIYDEFGGFTLGIIFAHELAHAAQVRADVRGPTIVTELQADCFAGAWAADVEAGNSRFFELTLHDLDRAVAGFLELRDGIGTAAADPAAHGTGFDRIGAFVEGYENGAGFCAEYPARLRSGELVIVEVPFVSVEDFERGGNLPLGDLIPAVLEDLEDFWTVLFQQLGQVWTPLEDIQFVDPEADEVRCGTRRISGEALVNASFYCVDSDTIVIDAVELIPALNEIGDYAVATEIARQYGFAAQVRMGNLDDTRAADLQVDCFAGLYASSGFVGDRQDQGLFLSPGDLDEAVIAFLLTSETSAQAGADDVETAFERFGAFRDGFMQGREACMTLRS